MAYERVLVVEDDGVLATLLKTWLKHEGWQATATPTAEEALEVIATASTPFDAVIVDCSLPGRDGRELLDELATHDQYRNVPRIAIGGDPGSLAGCRTATARFGKPFDCPALLSALAGGPLSQARR